MVKIIDVTKERKKEEQDLEKIITFLTESFIEGKSLLTHLVNRAPCIEIEDEDGLIAKYNHLLPDKIEIYHEWNIEEANKFAKAYEKYFNINNFTIELNKLKTIF